MRFRILSMNPFSTYSRSGGMYVGTLDATKPLSLKYHSYYTLMSSSHYKQQYSNSFNKQSSLIKEISNQKFVKKNTLWRHQSQAIIDVRYEACLVPSLITDLVVQRITRLAPDQMIAGSNPVEMETFFLGTKLYDRPAMLFGVALRTGGGPFSGNTFT